MKQHALLLVGELRMAKENQAVLAEMSSSYDVFVVTDRRYCSELQYLGDYKKALFVDDVLGFPEHEQFFTKTLNIPHALQMHKAHLALELLKKTEEKRGVKYKTVYKIRSDWDVDFNLDIEAFKKGAEDRDFIYMQSDMFYGGSREIADLWARFYFYILPRYYDRLHEYWPFECPDLNDCDLSAIGLTRFPFPSDVVGNPTSKAELEDTLKKCWPKIKEYTTRETEFFRLVNIEPKFPCEAAFAHYILNLGFRIKSLACGRIPIDPLRFYGNVSYLCNEIDKGNEEFVAEEILKLSPALKLHIPQELVKKLTSRNLISELQYKNLCRFLVPKLKKAGYHTNLLV